MKYGVPPLGGKPSTKFGVRALARGTSENSKALLPTNAQRAKARTPNRFHLAVLFSSCLLLTSCGKKSLPPAESQTPSQMPPPAGSKPTDATASAVPAEIDYSKTLDRLTQAVRKYAAETRSAPKSLNEVAAAGYIPEVPAAPAGKQFIIDDQLRVRLK
jgi:hypothetical protein